MQINVLFFLQFPIFLNQRALLTTVHERVIKTIH